MTNEVFDLAAARTPVGSFQRKLGPRTALELGAHAIRGALTSIQELKLDANKVNIYDDACAQEHPIGSTGSRLIVTLAHALERLNLKRGVASLCIGGGEATAVALSQA